MVQASAALMYCRRTARQKRWPLLMTFFSSFWGLCYSPKSGWPKFVHFCMLAKVTKIQNFFWSPSPLWHCRHLHLTFLLTSTVDEWPGLHTLEGFFFIIWFNLPTSYLQSCTQELAYFDLIHCILEEIIWYSKAFLREFNNKTKTTKLFQKLKIGKWDKTDKI